MRALITGATGFIGSNLTKKLQKENWQLNLFVRPNSNYKYLKSRNTNIFFGDIKNYKDVKKAMSGVDVVFNLAAVLPHHKAKKEEYWQTNVLGVNNLIDLSRDTKLKHFVHISTVGVYDEPPSAYSTTKKKAEDLLKRAFVKYKIPVTIIRPAIGYGPGDTRPGFLNLMKFINKGISIYIGRGDNYFHTVYVENLVNAIIKVINNDKAIGEDFIIGDEPCPTMEKIIHSMEKVLAKKTVSLHIPLPFADFIGYIFDVFQKYKIPALLKHPRVKFLSGNKKYDIEKAKNILKWNPSIGLEEGLKNTYAWYIKNDLMKR